MTKNIPNGRTIFQMTAKYTKKFYSKGLQNTYTQIGIIGMQKYDLATLFFDAF
jgi:hypothetical protein